MTLALEISGLEMSFGPTKVLEDVSFSCGAGELLGVIGPNGGGKTVLLKLILGLLKPDKGIIRVFGKPPERARGQVGYVPQFMGFDLEFPISVEEVVLTGRQVGGRLFRRLTRKDRELTAAALARVDMSGHADVQLGKLSGGQLQRVLIARALVTEPKMLLLDEPTSNLDPTGGHNLYELLAELSQELTVVLVSHDVGVISRYITKVACVNRRLFFHDGPEVPAEFVEQTYNCPVHVFFHDHDCRPGHRDHEEGGD